MASTATIADIFETLEYGPAPESADAALAWIEARGGEVLPFIGGSFRRPNIAEDRGGWFDTLNPATAKPLARVAWCGAAEVDAAVAAARAAQSSWWDLGCHGRARHLYALARHIQKNARLLAVLETLDNGKPIRETRDLDVPLVARHFYHHAGWAQLMERELPGQVPLGVAGQIIPWNFPLLMLAWKIAPALAMGNTVVLKPAEFTPLTAFAFAEICRDSGLPPGVVNILTGDGRTGELIVRHPGIDKIAFTGSTEVGRILREATAGTGKKLSLELGGKSPFLVFDDADLDGAVEGVVDAIWFNQGEVCCAGSRLLVQEGVAEALYAKLRARMETLRVGDPRDKAIDIGAIIAPVQLERIERLVRQGVEEGAKLWQPSWSCPREGWFYPPTLFTGRVPVGHHRPGRDLRPGARGHDLPHARRGHRAGEQHPLRPGRERLDGERQPRARPRRQDQGRHGVDQQHQPLRRRLRLRRLPRERLRARRRQGRALGVRPAPLAGGGQEGGGWQRVRGAGLRR